MDTEGKIFYKPKPYNKVPPETIIRHLSNEVAQLKRENNLLKGKLDLKERAIAEFKKWQQKVVEFKFDYWLNEAIKFLDNPPDPIILKRIRAVVFNHNIWNEWVRKVNKAYEATIKADRRLDNALQREERTFEDIALTLYPPKMVKTPEGELDMNEELRETFLKGIYHGIKVTINDKEK